MLDRDFVIRPDDTAVKQGPRTLNRVGMHVPAHPFLLIVVHTLVLGVFVVHVVVSNPFVRVDGLGIGADMFVDELAERDFADVGNLGQTDFPATLDGPGYGLLVGYGFGTPTGLTLTLIAGLTPKESFVDFDDTGEQGFGGGQGMADAMAEVPGGAISHAERPLQLTCADGLLALYNQIDGKKPLGQRKMGVVHDRPTGDGELIAAVVTVKPLMGIDS